MKATTFTSAEQTSFKEIVRTQHYRSHACLCKCITGLQLITTAARHHKFTRRSLSQALISHRAYFRAARAAASSPRSFTTSKAGDIPYSSARLAFKLKTASTAPAAMKGKGFLPVTIRRRLRRMLTGLLLAPRHHLMLYGGIGRSPSRRAVRPSLHDDSARGWLPAGRHTYRELSYRGAGGKWEKLLYLSWLHFPK